ncbi:MAG: 23S rRNA (uracil1939-C5)-methyltransferase [Candidatus Poriferisodalaceae bacterium]|jgi:23S rRNA (uracil1939-C5)-methyltransferase
MSFRVTIHDLAVGGDGVGRLDDGRVTFVPGAAVGDLLDIDLVEEKKKFTRGRIIEVIEPGEGRREPPCSQVALGCGGCDWQHLTEAEQVKRKVALVRSALERIGRLEVPEIGVRELPQPFGYRTQLRAAVVDGQAGFRARGSNDVLPTTSCEIAHAMFDDLLGEAHFGKATEASLRVAPRTGERLAVLDSTSRGSLLPEDVITISTNDIDSGKMTSYVEMVADRPWQVSADSFFQSSSDGAELLIEAVEELMSAREYEIGHLVDLYGGVGLFSGTIGDRFEKVTLVESSLSASEDAEVNLDEDRCTVVKSPVERWTVSVADVVIADPPRTGLKAKAVEKVKATGAKTVVLVSCDAGAMGRDAGLLVEAGYTLTGVTLVDLFPQTSHVEVVTGWSRVS